MKYRSDYAIMPEDEIIKSLMCCKDGLACPQSCPYVNEPSCYQTRNDDILLLLKKKDQEIIELEQKNKSEKTEREELEYKRGYNDGVISQIEKIEVLEMQLNAYKQRMKWINAHSSEENMLLKSSNKGN